MFARLRSSFALFIAAILGASVAFGGGLPLVPSNPTYSDPSGIIATLNAIVNQLNGQAGYAPAQVVSLGSSCSSTAGGTPVVCNGQRGIGNFTGLTVAATGTNQVVVITNSSVAANSICQAQFISAFTAGSAVVVGPVVPTAGSLSIAIANAGATTNAVTTGALGFSCT